MDPGQMFDQMSGGKNEIVISEVTDQRRQWFLNRIAQNAGATNGKITRDQYISGMQTMMAGWGNRGRGPGGVPQRPADPAATPQGGGGAGGSGGPPPANYDAEAEAEFKRLDLNGDGFLNQDEMNGRLRREWQQWDTNKDGKIDLKEFKAYYANRMQQRGGGGGGFGVIVAPVEEEEKKPPVYRAGKLPKGIPDWFEKLDTDKDGQIGLYEWKKSGKSIDEFLEMDTNQDGFLTIQEVMKAEAKKKKPAGNGVGSQVNSGGTGAGQNSTGGQGQGQFPAWGQGQGQGQFPNIGQGRGRGRGQGQGGQGRGRGGRGGRGRGQGQGQQPLDGGGGEDQ
jgi:Ca2+-binding EF-hand superfamily protein